MKLATNEIYFTLFLLTKFPRLGSNKSRLIKSGLPETLALEFSQKCVLDIVDNLGTNKLERLLLDQLASQSNEEILQIHLRRVILTSPGENLAMFRAWLSDSSTHGNAWEIESLNSSLNKDLIVGNLGCSLSSALVERRAAGDIGVSFIGMDTPQLTAEDITKSMALVIRASYEAYTRDSPCSIYRLKASIYAATDGGYVLLSLPCKLNNSENIFQDVTWSTETAFETQVYALEKAGLTVVVGEEVYFDVDTMDALKELKLHYSTRETAPCRLSIFLSNLQF